MRQTAVGRKYKIKETNFMNLWNLKIKEFVSFNPIEKFGANYEFTPLVSDIQNTFISDINVVEKNPNYLLCLRGDSMTSLFKHNRFLNKELNKFFIIGNKAKSYYKVHRSDDFEYYKGKSKSELLKELQELIDTCNFEIKKKSPKHRISGQIDNTFILNLESKTIAELEHWRLFFISFLHNNGKGTKYRQFKDYSPFVSLTYGNKKKSIARKFAINRAKHGTGLIYIVVVDLNKPNYIKTNNLISELSNFGIDWYLDRHQECMLLNGIFPHYILGLFEVKKTRTPRLIVNPWLYKEYKNDRHYDLGYGIPVNQRYFDEWIKKDDYKRYFFNDYYGNQYVSEIYQSNTTLINKFIKPSPNKV